MNFRKLIEKAMHEAQAEFALIVSRKLAELMGDAEVGSAVPRRRVVRAAGKPLPSRADARAGSRGRAPANHMAELREKVLSALKAGEPMKKNQIMKAARLSEREGARVGNILRKLKDDGLVGMKGQKAIATYTLGRKGESD
ncbi:MAG: hypothetical protein NVS3B20_10680 [Polyangiales bacterium]